MVETIRLNTAVMQAAMSKATSNREKLKALIRAELESINGQTGEAMAVLVYEWRSLSDESRSEVLALRDRYEALWLSVLQELRVQGGISADPFIVDRKSVV